MKNCLECFKNYLVVNAVLFIVGLAVSLLYHLWLRRDSGLGEG